MLRLDRFLCECDASLTRKTAKDLLRSGAVTLNGKVCTDPGEKIAPEEDTVTIRGEVLKYRKYRYFLLNKPAGVLSASNDRKAKTVIDLIPEAGDGYFPVGRLDRDTTGLLLITNDGPLAHELLSPKKHVPKTYLAECSPGVSEEACERLREGIALEDFTTMPARVNRLVSQPEETVLAITIQEGKYHQVKRMVAAVGSEVRTLRRICMGGLWLPAELAEGDYLELEQAELLRNLFEDKNEDEERLLRSYL
ncbi:MAG: rRNA pseudouridine synthase [Lachnospiraceae bacterium]|nr:rRNA pseudouridine synthase [Lachnospiraceae bacterium]